MSSQYPAGIRLHLGYFRARDASRGRGQTSGEMRARLDGVDYAQDERLSAADGADLTDAPQDNSSSDA